MARLRGIAGVLLAIAVSLGSVGCLRKVLLDGNISSTREGSKAVNTIHDFEIAAAIARSGLATLEGMHKLAPYNEDALLMLTRGWGAATSAFTEDEYEMALEAGDDELARYHNLRAQAGYRRARFYGIELMSKRATGFEKATKNANTMKAWATKHFNHPDEAEDLLWISFAWLAHVGSASDQPDVVGELYIGAALLERSLELDDQVEHGLGHTVLGAYHARTAMAELDDSKEHFEASLKINDGKLLQTKLNYAHRYYCAKSDKKMYEKLLNEVLAEGDTLPDARLSNVVAKRKARRYLDNPIFQENCGFLG